MSSKIQLRQSSIVINKYTLCDMPQLEYMFSLWNDITFSSYFKGMEYKEDTQQLILPRGIDVPMLENMFQSYASIDRNVDKYDHIEPSKMKYMPRDDIQKRAIAFMYGVKEYDFTKKYSQLALNLNTGKGKTYCSIAVTTLYKMRSIFIMNSSGWIEQWKNCIMEYTNTSSDEIYIIEGSGSIVRLLQKDISQYKYILATHATLRSYGEKNGWDKITELFKFMKIGLKFYDEAHLNFDNICKIDFYTNTYKTFYITATPARSSRDENVIYNYYFKNVPSIDLFDGDNDPHTDYIAIKYNSRPTARDIQNCRTRKGFSSVNYANYVCKQQNFIHMLRIVINIAMKHGKTLIYLATIDAIDYVYNWILNEYPNLSVGKYHSKVQGNKEDQLQCDIILSTTKSCGAATDIRGLQMTIMLAEPFRSEVLARQTLGRTRGNNTKYIDIVDIGFKSCRDFFNSKKDIFKTYAKSYNVITLDDFTLVTKSKELTPKKNLQIPAFIDNSGIYNGCMIKPAYIVPAFIIKKL
jgi:superfamily II DNA or RNA helicase